MALVKFITGDAASFASLFPKDADTLYFITDERRIYKGDVPMSGGIYKTVSALPETDSAEVNTLYVNTTDGSVSYFNGTTFQTVVKPTSTAIDGSGDDLHFPSTKAVVDYVTSKVSDLDVGELEGRVTTIEGQIQTINGSGDGSIVKAEQNAKDYADSLASNYAPAEHTHILSDITDAGDLAALDNVAEANLDTALASKINGKADSATTLAGYGITDAYTSEQIDTKIAEAVAAAPHLKRSIVESLPDVESADQNTIYMVGTGAGSEDSSYKEYMVINGAFELVGDSKVDLTDYATKAEVTEAIGALDVTDTAVDGQYVSQVAQTDGKITVTRAELPVKSVTEGKTNGTIAVNGTDVNVHGLGNAAYTSSSDYATAAQGALADSALQKADITTGATEGTIAVDGTDVEVNGLGSAAFTDSDAYATAEQGTKADTAVQPSGITTGSANGTIAVNGSDVSVKGLDSAAYTASTAYATAAQGTKADEAYAALTWGTL